MWGIAATASTRTAPRNLDFNFDVQETGDSSVTRGWGFPGHDYAASAWPAPAPSAGGNPSSEKSHVISLGQFLICPENVGIATTRFQSLKYGSGNYVRHLWGTMRVCHALAGNPYFRGLAVDSRIVRTGLKVWCCVGASGPDSRSSAAAAGPTPAPRRIAGPTPDAGPHAAGSASADKAGPASVGTRGLARSREAATPRSAARSRSRTVRGRRLVSRAR